MLDIWAFDIRRCISMGMDRRIAGLPLLALDGLNEGWLLINRFTLVRSAAFRVDWRVVHMPEKGAPLMIYSWCI